MVYETIKKGLDYICQNTGKALATGALVIMPLFGPIACTTVQGRAPIVQDSRDQLKSYRQEAESYGKDKVINPDEVPAILGLREDVKAYKAGLKGDDKVTAAMRDDATSIEGILNGYLNGLDSDPRVKSSIIVIRKKDSTSSNRISGENKDNKIPYSGTVTQHADLGVKSEDVYRTMQPDGNWGFEPGYVQRAFEKEQAGDRSESEEIKRKFATKTVVVREKHWANVPKYFPSGEIRCSDGTRFDAEDFKLAMQKGQIVGIHLVYQLEYKEGERTEGQKLLEQIEKAKAEGAEQPPKPHPRPRANDKKGKGIDNFGVDDD